MELSYSYFQDFVKPNRNHVFVVNYLSSFGNTSATDLRSDWQLQIALLKLGKGMNTLVGMESKQGGPLLP